MRTSIRTAPRVPATSRARAASAAAERHAANANRFWRCVLRRAASKAAFSARSAHDSASFASARASFRARAAAAASRSATSAASATTRRRAAAARSRSAAAISLAAFSRAAFAAASFAELFASAEETLDERATIVLPASLFASASIEVTAADSGRSRPFVSFAASASASRSRSATGGSGRRHPRAAAAAAAAAAEAALSAPVRATSLEAP